MDVRTHSMVATLLFDIDIRSIRRNGGYRTLLPYFSICWDCLHCYPVFDYLI